eukprot:m.292451 g.292451  ORF g.292451 m.292451 type:complete len:202 (+) comp20001_c0_seq3:735-1340(+)
MEHDERSRLGPSLPLPLIRQTHNSSEIVEQPTDLRKLNSRLYTFADKFIKNATSHGIPFFAYVAFGHVHTATPDINPPSKQYSGCAFVNSTRRGYFGDALAEVDWFAGKMYTQLQQEGIEKNTLVLFASDNGPSLRWGLGAGSTGIFTGRLASDCSTKPSACGSNGPYWDTGKGSTWEGSCFAIMHLRYVIGIMSLMELHH